MSSDTCSVKRGFFMLRPCGNSASAQCSECQRAICGEHISALEGRMVCVECKARKTEANRSRQPVDYDPYDRNWAYSYRHGYYSSYGYHPIWWGSYYGGYHDDYDVRSFTPEKAQPADLEQEESGPELLDS